MKKSDLKSGMIVELRNGKRWLFMKECETRHYGITDVLISDGGYDIMSNYDEGMLSNGLFRHAQFDIMKVYWDSTNGVNALTYNMNRIPLYWERKEYKELTISEIETKLGLEKGTLKIK